MNNITDSFLPLTSIDLKKYSLLDPSSAGSAQGGVSSFEDLLSSITATGANDDKKKVNSADNSGNEDQLMKFLQQILSSMDDSLQNILSPADSAQNYVNSVYQADTGSNIDSANTSSYESILAGGGPLPTFLKEVDARLHLDPAHQQALRDIAEQNKDVVKTPDSVHQIAMELQAAGI